jgi:hypothetical protein
MQRENGDWPMSRGTGILGPVKHKTLYYPECDGHLFFVDIPSQGFFSDADAIQYFKKKYGSLLMAVVKDNDPEITAVYQREDVK